jgi:hypothetical protein
MWKEDFRVAEMVDTDLEGRQLVWAGQSGVGVNAAGFPLEGLAIPRDMR